MDELLEEIQQFIFQLQTSSLAITKDRLNNQYNVSSAFNVWTLDSSERDGTVVTTFIDLATRKAVGLGIEQRRVTTEFAIAVMRDAMTKYPAPRLLHTDQAGEFTSEAMKKFLRENNIQHSIALSGFRQFRNQVNESFNARIWRHLRCFLAL